MSVPSRLKETGLSGTEITNRPRLHFNSYSNNANVGTFCACPNKATED